MIITIVADVFGKENNGTAITARRLIDSLKERGHEVRVVSPFVTDEEGFYTVPKRNFYCFNNYVAKNGVELAKPDKKVLTAAIKGCDVVHVMMPFKLGRAALKIARKNKIPVTAGFHCQPENFSSHVHMKDVKAANDFLYKRFDRVLYKHVACIHSPSEFIEKELRKHGYKAPIRVISNGVAPAYKKIESERPEELKDYFLILFTGRFAGEKRHDLLVKGVAESKYRDKIQIICAGSGPTKEHTEALAEKLGIRKPLIGFHDPEDLNKIINYCDLYVHPADVEIEAIAALEAITCGLVPVINNSERSATRYFARDERNLFDGTPEDLAKKIDYWVEHPDEKATEAAEYIEYGKRFELGHCIDQMEKMFEDIINDNVK